VAFHGLQEHAEQHYMVAAMSRKDVALVCAACGAGFFGGMVSPRTETVAAGPEIIRASAYELVNTSGELVARWAVGDRNGVRIQFFAGRGLVAFDLGTDESGRPFVRMNGKDLKNRIALTLDQYDKPSLVMSDERWEGRLHLGFVPPDTIPYGDWDRWGIITRGVGSQNPAAGLMVIRQRDGKYEGSLRLDGRVVR
jgi:hypothetical protein